MAGAMPPLPPIEPEVYKWNQSKADPGLWHRRACGFEVTVGLEASNIKGENDLFYSASVQLQQEYTLSQVKKAAQRAWMKLRFHHPEIACTVAYDGQLKPLLEYRAPKDDHEAQQWAERTIVVEASDRTPMDVRDANVKSRKGEARSTDSALIYILASVPDESVRLHNTELRLLFHSNHLYFDGLGFREMINAFFSGLANELPSLSNPFDNLPWHESVKSLPPPVVELMGSDQQISGPEFDTALQQHLGAAFRGLDGWGFQTTGQGSGVSKTLFRSFSKQETQKIVGAVKKTVGKEYNITHLTTAAVLLALVKMNPPIGEEVPDSAPFYSPATVDGRRFMKEPYKDRSKAYFPVSQCSGMVVLENIKQYVQPEGIENGKKTCELLSKALKIAKQEIDRCLKHPNPLSIAIPIFEMFAGGIASDGSGQAELSKNLTWPMVSSDGINEKFISHEYSSPNIKEPIFSIIDVFFWLNQFSSVPSIRLSSFRDCARLSLDFNDAHHSPEKMQILIEDIARYMTIFGSQAV